MEINWEDGSTVKVRVEDGETVVISANKEGLLSLAAQLTDMSNEETGCHIHYDAYNSLEDGSPELIIEKIE